MSRGFRSVAIPSNLRVYRYGTPVTFAQITIISLEHALDSVEDRLRERENDLAPSRRQSADLAKQLAQPFVHEEKLFSASKRQQEIVAALDITKNQAAATVAQDDVSVAAQVAAAPRHGSELTAAISA